MIIVSGLSGAGKTAALHALEDLGFYCIDNLPSNLLSVISESDIDSKQPIVIGTDIRSHLEQLDSISDVINQIKQKPRTKIIFLSAEQDVLIKRFNESRRKHPLFSGEQTLIESIEKEKKLLSPFLEQADYIVDTSSLSVYDLNSKLASLLLSKTVTPTVITLISFGFKYGIPSEADLVFDVRFLPNPYWEKDLKHFNGKDEEITQFLSGHPQTEQFIRDTTHYLFNWFPHYLKNNRSYLTIAIGCTGGKHRSVFIAESITKQLRSHFEINIRHKHISMNSSK